MSSLDTHNAMPPRKDMSAVKQTAQSTRFIEAAKKAEADESGKKFELAFKKIAKKQSPASKK